MRTQSPQCQLSRPGPQESQQFIRTIQYLWSSSQSDTKGPVRSSIHIKYILLVTSNNSLATHYQWSLASYPGSLPLSGKSQHGYKAKCSPLCIYLNQMCPTHLTITAPKMFLAPHKFVCTRKLKQWSLLAIFKWSWNESTTFTCQKCSNW